MWVTFILLNVFFNSLKIAFGKNLGHSVPLQTIVLAQWTGALLLLIPLTLWQGIAYTEPVFWIWLILSTLLNLIATLCFWRSIKLSDISLVLPLAAFTPLFTMILSPILTHEIPNVIGGTGIVIIMIGSYLLNIQKIKQCIWRPFVYLINDRGCQLMLFSTFIWSITANLDKLAIRASTPMIYASMLHISIALLLSGYMHFQRQPILKPKSASLLFVGLSGGIANIFYMFAVPSGIIPNIVALKRSDILLGMLWAALFFHEKHIQERLLGACIMLGGVALIVFWG